LLDPLYCCTVSRPGKHPRPALKNQANGDTYDLNKRSLSSKRVKKEERVNKKYISILLKQKNKIDKKKRK